MDNVVVTPHLAASTAEAQDRAGVIVAEQVAAALEGGLVTNAVNIPAIGPEDMEVLGPFVPLAAKLGRLAMELAGGRAERIELAYFGTLAEYDVRLLTVAALNGAFQGRTEQAVNYVNAPLIAAEHGVEVTEERRAAARDFTSLLRVTVRADGREERAAGTTIGRDHRLWLVSALGYQVEIELAPQMVFFRYDDVPGVIGRVGHDVRRGRRQHRQHGRVQDAARRQGGDGALRRLARAARAGGAPARGHGRGALHLAGLTPRRPLPLPRVAKGEKLIADNRRARHEYQLLDRVEAGLVLTGTEVKALRESRADARPGVRGRARRRGLARRRSHPRVPAGEHAEPRSRPAAQAAPPPRRDRRR